MVAVRWYLRLNLSYRDVEELLVERGVEVDQVTVFRWVQAAAGRRGPVRLTPRPVVRGRNLRQGQQCVAACISGDRPGWAGHRRADLSPLRRGHGPPFLPTRAHHLDGDTERGGHRRRPDLPPGVLEELLPAAWHHVERHANNPIDTDHSQLKHRLRSMRRLRTNRTAQVIIAGHSSIQNLRRGHYELAVDVSVAQRVVAAFTELAQAI